jgi:hypothetical protein
MKTNSQTSIRGVYEMMLRPGLQGRPDAPPALAKQNRSPDRAYQGNRQDGQEKDERDRDDDLGYQDHDLPEARHEQ